MICRGVAIEKVTASNASGKLGQYAYDGDGKRVKKVVPSTGETTVFAYDASGKMVAEYSTNVEPVATAKVNYLTADHLGSPRVNTDASGEMIARHDYLPFGEEIDGVGGRTTGLNYGDDTIRKQFTGYERDTETALDFAQARMYGSNRGRFLSPDPRTYGSVFELGTWNHYVYGLNNPYSFVDRKGRWPEWIHRMITDLAFPGLTAEEINQIHRGNRRVDYAGAFPDTVNPKKSFQHSMYNTTYNPPGIMELKRQAFIDAQLAIARDPLNRDDNGFPNEAANEAFGASRHPSQDAASPAHSGENSYYETPSPIAWFLGGGTAFAYASWRHYQIESTITREQLHALVREERVAYRNAFGNANYERATTSLFLLYIVPKLKLSLFPSDSDQKKEEGDKKDTGWEACPGFVPTKEITGCRIGPIEDVY
ncbi:MAG: RHS repeat-associated core domain-containing protein [Pyrinomonadaceae bacterium]